MKNFERDLLIRYCNVDIGAIMKAERLKMELFENVLVWTQPKLN